MRIKKLLMVYLGLAMLSKENRGGRTWQSQSWRENVSGVDPEWDKQGDVICSALRCVALLLPCTIFVVENVEYLSTSSRGHEDTK